MVGGVGHHETHHPHLRRQPRRRPRLPLGVQLRRGRAPGPGGDLVQEPGQVVVVVILGDEDGEDDHHHQEGDEDQELVQRALEQPHLIASQNIVC